MKWTAKLKGPQFVNHAGFSWNNWIFSIGGYCSLISVEYDRFSPLIVYRMNINTLRWQQCPSPEICEDPTFPRRHSYKICQRYGHTIVGYCNKFYMWGGRNNISTFNDLHCFNPETLNWFNVSTNGPRPPAADGHSACVIDDKMYIFGGYEYSNDFYTNRLQYFDFKRNTWRLVHTTGDPPAPKDFHSAVVVGSKMYIYGGRSCENINQIIYDPGIKYFDTTTLSWHNVDAKGDIPDPRRSHSAWIYNDEMYMFGGYNETINKHYNDLYKFSFKTNQWTKLEVPGKIPEVRRRQVCVNVLDKVYLFGGTGPSPNQETIQYDDNGEEKLFDKDDLHILDYSPSLKILCIDVVLKHNLDTSSLPQDIRWDIKMMTINRYCSIITSSN